MRDLELEQFSKLPPTSEPHSQTTQNPVIINAYCLKPIAFKVIFYVVIEN